jgi:hypothetical protein
MRSLTKAGTTRILFAVMENGNLAILYLLSASSLLSQLSKLIEMGVQNNKYL